MPHATLVCLPSSQAFGWLAHCALPLCVDDDGPNCPGYCRRNFVLDSKNVGQIAVEAVCPNMSACCGINELCSDSGSCSGPADAAFKNVTDAEFTAHLLDVDRPAFVCKARIAGDHKQPAKLRQLSRHVLGDPVPKELLIWVTGHIGERQNCDRGLVWKRKILQRHHGFVTAHTVGWHRVNDVFEGLSAKIFESKVKLTSDLIVDFPGDEYAAGVRNRLQPRRDVDTIAIHASIVKNHVTLVDPDPELHPSCRIGSSVALGHGLLDCERALHGAEYAGELGEDAVAGRV